MDKISNILNFKPKTNLNGFSPTPKQKEILEVLIKFFEKNNRMPTIAEIQEITGHKAMSNVILHLKGLEDRGYIERIKYKATAIKLLRNLNGSLRIE